MATTRLFFAAQPVLVTLLLIFVTRRTNRSMFIGLLWAGLQLTNWQPLAAVKLVVLRLWANLQLGQLFDPHTFWHCDKFFLLLFTYVLSVFIALIQTTGVAKAYADFCLPRIRQVVPAQLCAMLLSAFLFIDDYLSILVASRVNPALTDRFRIPRLKIAFLTSAMASPVCALIPLSSWGAVTTLLLSSSGPAAVGGVTAQTDGLLILVKSLPFNLMPLFTVFVAFWIVVKRISFGTLRELEGEIIETPVMTARCKQAASQTFPWVFILPMVGLLVCTMLVVLYTGSFVGFGGTNSLIDSVVNSATEFALLAGSMITLLISFAVFKIQGRLDWDSIPEMLWHAFEEIRGVLTLLLLAWTTASFLVNDFQTGQALATCMVPYLSLPLFPLVSFLVTAIITFALSSAWATISMVFPILLPMLHRLADAQDLILQEHCLLYLTVGAILSGAIMGGLLAPSSDVLTMTSRGSGVKHTDFLKVQWQYLFKVGLVSALGFVVGGFGYKLAYGWLATLLPIAGMFIVAAMFLFFQYRADQKELVEAL